MEYKVKDLILPGLALPHPVPIRIELTGKDVLLYIGPRDWQWDRNTGRLVGCGTCVDAVIPPPESDS